MLVLRSTCSCLDLPYVQIYVPLGLVPCLCLDPCVYVLYAIFVCLDLHAHAFFAMFMLRSSYLCLDLCLFGPRVMLMFRSMCLCALCHVCVLRSICWLLVSCASIALLSLDISLSCVLALVGGVQIQIPRSRPTSTHLGLYQRVWIISLHACVCLLASALYLYACLSRSWLCHALCPPWTCSCMVTSIPLVAYWDLTTCETHSCDVGFLDAHPFSGPCNVACHAYFVPPIQLSSLLCIIFACLPTCSCLSLCLLVSSSLIPTISYGFTLIFETRDPKSLFGIFLDSTCFIHTLI